MSIRHLPLAVALLALAAACHSASITDFPPSEVYLLQSIDGRPLPTTRANDPARPVLREQLVLTSLGVADRNTTVQGSFPNTETTISVSYRYTKAGDVVTLGDFVCTGNVPCAQHPAEQGTTDGNILTLGPVPSLSSVSGSVLVYRRSSFVD